MMMMKNYSSVDSVFTRFLNLGLFFRATYLNFKIEWTYVQMIHFETDCQSVPDLDEQGPGFRNRIIESSQTRI